MVKNRTDAKKNKAKIIKEVLINPLQTQREIAKGVWLSKTTIQEHLKELPNTTKDDRIIWICDTDLEIVILWQEIIKNRLMDEEELKKISARDISWIIKENTARYTIFKWDATDSEWWMKLVEWITIKIE